MSALWQDLSSINLNQDSLRLTPLTASSLSKDQDQESDPYLRQDHLLLINWSPFTSPPQIVLMGVIIIQPVVDDSCYQF